MTNKIIQKEHLHWLETVPPSDINFKCHLKEANAETIREVLKIDMGKTKRAVLERRLRKLEK